MAALLDIIKKGSTDRSVTIRIIDSTDGTPETGVEHNTSGIDLWYRRQGAAKVSITEAALSALTDAHSDGGIEHIGDGEYRLDLPDAAFATGANHVDVGGTVTGMVVIGGRVRLVDYDPEDAVRGGMTALPNAAAAATGGLPTVDASNAVKVQSGTGANQLSLSNGVIAANVTQNAGSNITASGGRQEVNLTHYRGTACPAGTQAGVPVVDTTYWVGNLVSHDGKPDVNVSLWANQAVTVDANNLPDVNAAAISDDTTAADNAEKAFDGTGYNVGAGSIVAASVTGAVGSVTGNVGGNVTGSIGSLATQAKADVNAEADTALSDIRLDELLSADSDIDGAAPPTVGSVFFELMSKTTGSFTYDQTTDSNEALRDRGDAAWITATGFSTHSAADVVTSLGTGSTLTALATQASVDTIDGIVDAILLDTGTDGVVVASGSKTGYALTSGERDSIAAALLDLSNGIETGFTMRQTLRIVAAALAGELSGAATTTITIRDIADTKTRVTATVDSEGNRTALTIDAS